MNTGEFQAHTERIERALQQVKGLQDEAARTAALGLMQSLMDLHGAGLTRVLELLADSGESNGVLAKIADDPLVCGLLVLYGIHPLSVEERVQRAIERLQPSLQKIGTGLELVNASESVVRLRVNSSRADAHSVTEVRARIELAVREAAPEAGEIAIEGLAAEGFVPLNMVQPAMKFEAGEAV